MVSLPCAFCVSIPTNCMSSQSRSDSSLRYLRSLQSPRDETGEFLLETDQGRGLCSRQKGLAAFEALRGPRHHHRQAILYRYPTSTCYATKHWQSKANKIGSVWSLLRQTLKVFVVS